MKKLFVTLFSILILISCGDDNALKPNYITISLIESNNSSLFNKTVILFEDDEYLIVTYFDNYISSYPLDVLYGYDEQKQTAIQDTLTQDTILMQNYIKNNGDDTYTLAYHLENGSCLIYNKKLLEIIKTIQMEKWSTGGPMSTTAGRRFYIKEQLFLETVDLIS